MSDSSLQVEYRGRQNVAMKLNEGPNRTHSRPNVRRYDIDQSGNLPVGEVARLLLDWQVRPKGQLTMTCTTDP